MLLALRAEVSPLAQMWLKYLGLKEEIKYELYDKGYLVIKNVQNTKKKRPGFVIGSAGESFPSLK